jgi:hypothetical protein
LQKKKEIKENLKLRAEKEKEYLYHPLYKKFIDDNKHLWGKVQVFDSEMI